ncbi:RNA polymerase, sigma subunit, SigZ [Arenibacter nanhaiticus]|uniref:RNA polymerase, sigma subunit, SigZ n=1 Tax=Arenibacter nanhaiticus TaxID=558155 RepID=A0A1M6B0K2_9FLAO|nr:sigma-70 family RNA polymerase sigma factor [Arenibacter nanhaiticus]SHI42207.1 RNA polymerase, sigma subunit, SigZ [Arenibacter nanhaiticus]
MKIDTITIWNTYNSQLYFFILKKVKNKDSVDEILQNSFLKIHQNIEQLKNPEKVKAWTYQIVRNEIANHFKDSTDTSISLNQDLLKDAENHPKFCCFDKFIANLPLEYKEVIDMVFIKGKKQIEVAELLKISLPNVKARIRRGKLILKKNFNECCKFEINKEGKLVGEENCAKCN